MKKILSKEQWIKRKRRKTFILRMTAIFLFLVIIAFSLYFIDGIGFYDVIPETAEKEAIKETLNNGTIIKTDYLTPNQYSRPQTSLRKVKGIVVHYTANPGTSAENNRSYFQGLAKKGTTYASSHYIIGLGGEVLQCIPLNEISYASNDRNGDTISIECCHPDETGKFSAETYDSLVALAAQLCVEFNLDEEDVIRHYDVTEKRCPLYYVEHEDEWLQFKSDVKAEIKEIEANQTVS